MVWENIFSPVQSDPQADPVSYTISTVSCLGVKRPGLDVKLQPPSGAEVKCRAIPPLPLCVFMEG